ncbi:hypothetical protein V6N12_038026 [Hibiscus sabdariffa]|uniref:Uncharacterized protein n=1 Tax=Hibiscus sabdariffa TaxID=183260 RepID=A0ABR2BWK9_9ROSI
MLPKLWNGITSTSVQRPSLNKSAVLREPSSNASKGGGFQSSPARVEAPSLGDHVSQPMILSPINARGSRSAPIVYRRKAKSVFGQQQAIAENSCLQPAQTVSDVPVGNSTLQPVQNVSARPVVSSDLQSDPVVSSEMQSDPIVSSELQSERTASISTGQTARSVSDHAISGATSDAVDVLSQNQTMFIFEHIPWVVSQLLHPRCTNITLDFIEGDNGRHIEFPLMIEWHKKMIMPLKDSRNSFKESTFTDYFDVLSEDDIEWNPYARLSRDFLSPPYDGQVALERSLTSIICVEKRILHDPDVLMKKKLNKSHPLRIWKRDLKKHHRSRNKKDIAGIVSTEEQKDMKDDEQQQDQQLEYYEPIDEEPVLEPIPTQLQENMGDGEQQQDHQPNYCKPIEEPEPFPTQEQQEILLYRRKQGRRGLTMRQLEHIPLQHEQPEPPNDI